MAKLFDSITEFLTKLNTEELPSYYETYDNKEQDKPVPLHEGIFIKSFEGTFQYYYCSPYHPFADFCKKVLKSAFGTQPAHSRSTYKVGLKDEIIFFYTPDNNFREDYEEDEEYDDNYTDEQNVVVMDTIHNRHASYNDNNNNTKKVSPFDLVKPKYAIIPNSDMLNLYQLRNQFLLDEFSLTKILKQRILKQEPGYRDLESYIKASEASETQEEIRKIQLKLELLSLIIDKEQCTKECCDRYREINH